MKHHPSLGTVLKHIAIVVFGICVFGATFWLGYQAACEVETGNTHLHTS